ncbi:MAG TPA: hypothetical protein VFM34_11970 [Moraxellaceae bacterium]|nr:hypothetical protein [Moraxellaceae bacterium]
MLNFRHERYDGLRLLVELYDGDRYVATMSKEDAARVIRDRLTADASNVLRDVLRTAVPKAQAQLAGHNPRAAVQTLQQACLQLEKL